MSLKGRDIVTTEDMTKEDLLEIMSVTADMEKIVREERVSSLLDRYVVGILFLEPSTRTMLSFVTAAHRLSARPIVAAGAKGSSRSKGESLEDTAMTVEQYCDCIVVRQSEIGGASRMADAVEVPLINGGDGSGQHPTQALLDMYTIRKERGTLEGLTIAMVGDLKFGRTVHSLSYSMAHFGARYIWASPEELVMPDEIARDMKNRGVDVTLSNTIEDALDADVIYMTRIQRERFEDQREYDKLKGSYVLTREAAERAGRDALIMHPLPRVDEISADVDDLPNAAYFRQAGNGVYLRMALLAMVLGEA
jgi:aspartate carbamoyltransferase